MCDHKRKRVSRNVEALLEPRAVLLNGRVVDGIFAVSPEEKSTQRYRELVECYDCDVVISATRAMEE